MLVIFITNGIGSFSQNRTLYVIDSIPYYNTMPFIKVLRPKYYNLHDDEIAKKEILFDKTEINNKGYKGVDTVYTIVTKEFINRKPEFKKIPDVKLFTVNGGFVYYNNTKKPYSGPFIETEINGKITTKGFYKNGKIVGKLYKYDPNGRIKNKINISTGQNIAYWPNGVVRSKTNGTHTYMAMYSSEGDLLYKRFSDINNNYESKVKVSKKYLKLKKPIVVKDYFKDDENYNDYINQLEYNDSIIQPMSYESYFFLSLTLFNYGEVEGCIQLLDTAINNEPLDIELRICRLYSIIYKYEFNKFISIKEYSEDHQPLLPSNDNLNEIDLNKICEDLNELKKYGYNHYCDYMNENEWGEPYGFFNIDLKKVDEIYCMKQNAP